MERKTVLAYRKALKKPAAERTSDDVALIARMGEPTVEAAPHLEAVKSALGLSGTAGEEEIRAEIWRRAELIPKDPGGGHRRTAFIGPSRAATEAIRRASETIEREKTERRAREEATVNALTAIQEQLQRRATSYSAGSWPHGSDMTTPRTPQSRLLLCDALELALTLSSESRANTRRNFLLALRDGRVRAEGHIDDWMTLRSWWGELGPQFWLTQPDWRRSSARTPETAAAPLGAQGIVVLRQDVERTFRVRRTQPGKINVESACGRWILDIARDAKSAPVRPALFEQAREKFGVGLSERAFKRAWAANAPPEWKRAGTKSKRRIDSRE